jgi:hypothetical protein
VDNVISVERTADNTHTHTHTHTLRAYTHMHTDNAHNTPLYRFAETGEDNVFSV